MDCHRIPGYFGIHGYRTERLRRPRSVRTATGQNTANAAAGHQPSAPDEKFPDPGIAGTAPMHPVSRFCRSSQLSCPGREPANVLLHADCRLSITIRCLSVFPGNLENVPEISTGGPAIPLLGVDTVQPVCCTVGSKRSFPWLLRDRAIEGSPRWPRGFTSAAAAFLSVRAASKVSLQCASGDHGS